jgi:hypothetical protein
MMRSAGNFSPEWGYLAPAPSMLRTVRVVLVATAVGATAGAAVVLSLVDHPAGDADRVSVAAHAIVTSAQAAPAMESARVSAAPIVAPPITAPNKVTAAVAAPQVVQTPQVQTPQVQTPQVQAQQVQAAVQPSDPAQPIAAPAQPGVSAQSATPNDANAAAQQPAAVAALSDPAATDAPAVANDSAGATSDNEFVGPQQPQKKKHHTAGGYKDGFPDISGPLRHLFNARNGSASYYPSRAY